MALFTDLIDKKEQKSLFADLLKPTAKFDPEGSDYDYATARTFGGKPDVRGHWGSLDPRTGMVLKGKQHPTWDLMIKEEERLGNEIIKRNGRYYSKLKKTLDEMATKPRPAPPTEFELSDYSVPQPYDPSGPPTGDVPPLPEERRPLEFRAAPEPSEISKFFQRYIRKPITKRTGLFAPNIAPIGRPKFREEQPFATIGKAAIHHGAETLSGLGLRIPDILAKKISGNDTLAEALNKLTGFIPDPRDKKAGEAAKFISGLTTIGRAVTPIVAKIPARLALKTILSTGITFGTRRANEEMAHKIISGKPIDWQGIHFESGIGILFGAGEVGVAKFAQFVKGFKSLSKNQISSARAEVNAALKHFKATGDRTRWDAVRIKYAGITPKGVERIRARTAPPPPIKEFGKYPLARPIKVPRMAVRPSVQPTGAIITPTAPTPVKPGLAAIAEQLPGPTVAVTSPVRPSQAITRPEPTKVTPPAKPMPKPTLREPSVIPSVIKKAAKDKGQWKLTLDEYIHKYGKKGQDIGTQRAFFGLNHRKWVQQAIEQGKPIPAKVLAEYPDLAKPAKPTPAEGKVKPTPQIEGEVKIKGTPQEKKLVDEFAEGLTAQGWKKEYQKEKLPHWMTDKEPSPLSKELSDDLKKEGIKQANILEIGAGNGRDSIFLAKQGHISTGIDVAEQAITAAKKNAGKLKNVTFEKGNIEKLKYPDESFDAVFSVAALHSTVLDDSLAEIYRVLKPNGIAKIHQYTKIETAGKIIHSWKPKQIKEIAEKSGFSILESHTTSKTDMVEVEGVREKIKQDSDIIVYTIKKAKPAEAKAEITKEPGRAKTLETIREEGQKEADVTLIMPGNLEDETQFHKFVEQFPKIRSVDWPPVKAQKAIIKRVKNFAQDIPEFKLNPTFTFEKESGQLVFKDRYRFAFYPDHFGLDAEQLKDGQTIRFDLESFDIKKPTKAALRKAEPFLGEPKILGRSTKKPTPIEFWGEPKAKPRKPTKAYEAYNNALMDIEIGKKTEVPGGVTISKVTERDIEKAAKLGKKAGQKAWTVEKSILSRQERGLNKQTVDIDKAIKIIRNVFAKPKEPPGPSQIGFPGIEKVELPPEAVGKEPTTARKIIEHLSRALKVPYRSMATHRPRAALGWYEVRPVGIRQINVRSLSTAAHEVGHHIDYFWKIRRAGISKIGRKTWKMPEGTAKGTAAELTKLGKMLYGTRKPKGGYKSEGIAEFVRGYLTGHVDVKKEAPKFYNWFIKDYLPHNPEIADALHNAKSMLTNYRLQGAEARIESLINKKEIRGSIRDWAGRANLWLQVMFVDEFAPLRVGIEEAGIERAKLKLSEDPYELAVYFSQKEGARARQMVLFGTVDLWGNKTGKGLKEIMKPIADENAVREFTHWVVAARSLDLIKRGRRPGITKADAQYVYDLYKDNEGWKETAKEVTDWNHRVLDYLVQAGGLEKALADKMKKLNPIYVPFLRAFAKGEKRFGGGGAGRGLITTKKGVYGIGSSGREIIEPFESMIQQTRRIISIAHKSVIGRALARLEAKHRGLADFIWKVPAPTKATTFRAEQVIKQLQKKGVEVTGEGLPEPGEMMTGKPQVYDALLTVYGNSPIYLGKENIICIVENGKKSWYEVSPEMYRILQGLDKFYLPRFLDITLGKAGRTVRLGATGINASFGLVKNPIRDALDTVFKGTHARGPGASIKGVAKDLSRLGFAKSLGIESSKAAQEFVAMGGQISGFVGQDRKSLQHLRGEMLASSIGRYSIHTVNHPIDALRAVFGVPESGPRIQEYEKALEVGEKKYGKGSPDAKIYAFNKAQDQTINYSRHGVVGKWLNQIIPFWNANAQDISKVHRTFRTRGKQATAYAVAFLTLPALGLWWYNKDEEWYKEIPAYEKANYLHIDIPGKYTILRIPVPFLVGHIFQSFPVATVDALYRADKTKVTQFFRQVLKGDVYPLIEWPAIVSPIIDVLQNKDWAGRPIVPRGIEGKMPSDQYKNYTSEFCKIIGKIFNYSPAKIEHLLNSWSGGLYRRTGMATERLLGLRGKEVQPADWPLIGTLFVRDPYAPKASVEKFYKEKDKLNRMYQSKQIAPNSNLDKRRKMYNAISIKYLSPYWKALTKTKTIKQREQIYKKIGVLVKVK